jgi:hypothetical protein
MPAYAGEPDMPDRSVKVCGWILLAIANLRGAHLENAQSAYERACVGLTPAEIERAKSFAQIWRPSQRAGAAIEVNSCDDNILERKILERKRLKEMAFHLPAARQR